MAVRKKGNTVSDLTRLCELIAKGDYAVAKELFALTIEGATREETATLAESFGMMLVKVEAREFQLEKVIAELNAAMAELARREHSLASENALLKSRLEPGEKKPIIAESLVMQNLLREARRIAVADSTVLITGETGTGKSRLAREMHAGSRRAAGPFVSINCAGIPPTLFESELFGIEKGVASGVEARIGRFEQANGGTLFLDEIGDMPLESQAKILHVMDSGCVERVGGRKSIPVDVRVIAATHHDLQAACAKKLFRSDLFYRLNVISLHLPPLRERSGDIDLMAVSCLLESKRVNQTIPSGLTPEALSILRAYAWPGNIRELANEMERASLLAREELVCPNDLSARLLQPQVDLPVAPAAEQASASPVLPVTPVTPVTPITPAPTAAPTSSVASATPVAPGPAFAAAPAFSTEDAANSRVQRQLEGEQNLLREVALEAAEIELIQKTLAQTRGNKAKAARILGMSREGLRKKLIRLQIEE